MCELLLFFGGAVIAALLLWVLVLDNRLDEYKYGVRK